ncbi:GntR family transcriptional regulator [Pseudonocardia saturnea]
MTTKHALLATELRARIKRGEYGYKLPSEYELMRTFAMSRTTVRQALNTLQNDGLLRSESGVGYFVRTLEHFEYRPQDDFRRAQVVVPDADYFTDVAKERNPSQEIEVGVVVAPPDVERRLKLRPGTHVARRRRLRLLDGMPFQLNDSYYPLELVQGTAIVLPESIPQGVNQVLADLGHAQVKALDEIWVRMPSPDELQRLQLGPGTPVADHVITGITADDRPVRTVHTILPGDRNVITFERTHPDHEGSVDGDSGLSVRDPASPPP